MRKTVKLTDHPLYSEVAYGLDRLPVPGYFLDITSHDGESLVNLDTRDWMYLPVEPVEHPVRTSRGPQWPIGWSALVSSGTIAEILQRLVPFGVPEDDVVDIILDNPVGD